MIYQKQRDYRRACLDMQQAVKLDPTNHQAWNVLGLCSTSQGDIRDGVKAYEKAVEANPKLKEAWVNMGQVGGVSIWGGVGGGRGGGNRLCKCVFGGGAGGV